MADLRKCDLCGGVRPIAAPWHFVTDGKAQPSEWRMAEHWCPECMKAVREYFTLRH